MKCTFKKKKKKAFVSYFVASRKFFWIIFSKGKEKRSCIYYDYEQIEYFLIVSFFLFIKYLKFWVLKEAAFIMIMNKYSVSCDLEAAPAGSGTNRQAQAPAGTCLSRLSWHRLGHQPARTGSTGSCRHIPATETYDRPRPAKTPKYYFYINF